MRAAGESAAGARDADAANAAAARRRVRRERVGESIKNDSGASKGFQWTLACIERNEMQDIYPGFRCAQSGLRLAIRPIVLSEGVFMRKTAPAADPDAYVYALAGWRRECVE